MVHEKHVVPIESMKSYVMTIRMAGSHSRKENKSLDAVICNSKVTYSVRSNNTINVHESLDDAVSEYNLL